MLTSKQAAVKIHKLGKQTLDTSTFSSTFVQSAIEIPRKKFDLAVAYLFNYRSPEGG